MGRSPPSWWLLIGVCHADIKPNNIVSVDNQYVLLDWGLSADQALVRTSWTRDFPGPQPPKPTPEDDFWSLALKLHYLANVDHYGNVKAHADMISKSDKLAWAIETFSDVSWPDSLK